jgi:3-methyl-2-oxobutanoate hydroxymethyltransferase
VPKFVKRYGELAGQIEDSIKSYADEVRSRKFPGPEHVYGLKPKP